MKLFSKITAGLLCILITNGMIAQNISLDWAYAAGSNGGPDQGESITTDASGNVYVVGTFGGNVDFDPGPDSSKLTSDGFTSVFVQKLDASGNFQWATSFGNNWTSISSIVTDHLGNVYLSGTFQLTTDFDPGVDTVNLSSSGKKDIYIQKLDEAGNFLWAKSVGGTDSDEPLSIDVDASGNIYITGSFESNMDFDPGPGISNLNCNGKEDIFVLKLDVSGDFLWAKSIGGVNEDIGASINIGPFGSVYLTGHFHETMDFDPGPGTYNLTASNLGFGGAKYPDIFVQKLDRDGNFVWANSFGAHIYDLGQAISTDASGNVYVSGSFGARVDFDPGADSTFLTGSSGASGFVQKLDASGNLLWAKVLVNSTSMTTDTWGNVYLSGNFQDTQDFDTGADSSKLTALGYRDIFIQKLDVSGNFLWANAIEVSDQGLPKSICVDDSGNILTTGRFLGTIDFDPGTDTLFSTAMPPNIFTLKMTQDAAIGEEESPQFSTIELYPNPTTGKLSINLGDLVKPEVRIYSIHGELLQEMTNISVQSFDLFIKGPAGIYFVELLSENTKSETFKIIKH